MFVKTLSVVYHRYLLTISIIGYSLLALLFSNCRFMALSTPFVEVLGKEKDDHFNTNGRVYAIVIGNGNAEDVAVLESS